MKQFQWWHVLILLVIIPGAIILAAWRWEPIAAWLFAMALLLVSIFAAGWLVTGSPRGFLIDERNRLSLSRLQAVVWTVLVLAAFVVMAIQNIDHDKKDPLSIKIPEEIWVVIGISATSLVGSPLVRSTKETTRANTEQATLTFRRLGMLKPGQHATADGDVLRDANGQVIARGQIAVNPSPSDSQWADLFRGEETSNAANLDLGKVQMFYFTLVLVAAYGVALGKVLDGEPPFSQFPMFDDGMVALLGISHAGYLANKVVPRTQAP